MILKASMRVLQCLPVLIGVIVLSACSFAIHGEDAFRKAADRRGGVVERPLEEVYRCFLGKGVNTGYQQLYPESGEAVWSSTPGGTYIAMAEFKRLGPSRTNVTVLGLRDGDWTQLPETIWAERVTPCAGVR